MGQDFGSLQPPSIKTDMNTVPLSYTTNSSTSSSSSNESLVTTTTTTTNAIVSPLTNHKNNQWFIFGNALQSQIKLYGGQVSNNLHVGVSHIVIQPNLCSSPARIEDIQVCFITYNYVIL